MKKFLLSLILTLVSFVPAFAQTATSNFTSVSGRQVAGYGTLSSYQIDTQDDVNTLNQGTALNIQGSYGSGQPAIFLANDPVNPGAYFSFAKVGTLTSFQNVATSPLTRLCGKVVPLPTSFIVTYTFNFGENYDEFGNPYATSVIFTVPYTYAGRCVSAGGRGGNSAPVYTAGQGHGTLTETRQ